MCWGRARVCCGVLARFGITLAQTLEGNRATAGLTLPGEPACAKSLHPLTAPAVSPETICLWKTSTSRNKGAVIDTAAAIA